MIPEVFRLKIDDTAGLRIIDFLGLELLDCGMSMNGYH